MVKHFVIMAGGSGTRLWPLSRYDKPKQYISLHGEKCMLVQTIERLNKFTSPDHCHIVTNADQRSALEETLDGLIPASNIIYEPASKDTAACIATSALLLKKRTETGIMCCIPSDSYISNQESFEQTMHTACREAEEYGKIVIVGISPSFPATGYGYIHLNPDRPGTNPDVFRTDVFLEKPDQNKAVQLFSSGEYLWNSGMVVARIDSLLKNIKEFLPEMFQKLSEAVEQPDNAGQSDMLKRAYGEITGISFDHGVLEKSRDVYVAKAAFDWSDIGCLDALDKVLGSDADGNAIWGTHAGMDTKHSVVYAKDSLVATIGLENMIIIDTGDVIFVCPRDRIQDIRTLLMQMKRNGLERYI